MTNKLPIQSPTPAPASTATPSSSPSPSPSPSPSSPSPAPSTGGNDRGDSSPAINPHSDIARYAYIAESAVWDFHNARAFRDEHYADCRQVCELYASSARQALQALLIAADTMMGTGQFNGLGHERVPGVVGTNLVRALEELRAADAKRLPPGLAIGDPAMSAARRLSRVLHAGLRPAGNDFMLRDYYDHAAVLESHAAAEVLVAGMVERLLDLSLDQLEDRYHRLLRPPMLDIRLWVERDRWRRRAGERTGAVGPGRTPSQT